MLYRASDALMKHWAVIERVLYDRVHDLWFFRKLRTLDSAGQSIIGFMRRHNFQFKEFDISKAISHFM